SQAPVVGEVADRGIGVPGRHDPILDVLGDRLRPRPHLVVGQQRHRSDLVGAMTPDAALGQDGGDVVVVGRAEVGGGGGERGGAGGGEGSAGQGGGDRGDQGGASPDGSFSARRGGFP